MTPIGWHGVDQEHDFVHSLCLGRFWQHFLALSGEFELGAASPTASPTLMGGLGASATAIPTRNSDGELDRGR